MKKLILLSIGALTAFLVAARSAPADRFDHLVRGKFFAGLAGDRTALEEGMKTCEDILAEHPKHAEAMVWYGVGLFQRSSEAFRAGKREQGIELFNKAMSTMDQAVELAPDHVGVRVPRGAMLLTASRFMPPEYGRPLLDRPVRL